MRGGPPAIYRATGYHVIHIERKRNHRSITFNKVSRPLFDYSPHNVCKKVNTLGCLTTAEDPMLMSLRNQHESLEPQKQEIVKAPVSLSVSSMCP